MSLASFSPHPTSPRTATAAATIKTSTTTTNGSSSSSTPSPMMIGQWFLREEEEEEDYDPIATTTTMQQQQQQKHWFFILPVLLLEFLAIGLTRAVLPSILIQEYGHRVYLVLGSADCIRGLLAFFACPLFGKWSDLWGRKHCLLITVLGSCAPVCSLAFFTWHRQQQPGDDEDTSTIIAGEYILPPKAIPLFVILLSISGIFSSTFTLVFAYIGDTIKDRNDRVSAFGLALACFGLSFTIGPMAGGYLAQAHTHYVFSTSFFLTILDLLYIQFVLPESLPRTISLSESLQQVFQGKLPNNSNNSIVSSSTTTTRAWSPLQSVTFLLQDPFLRKVGEVALFYYTGVWAVISTLSLYAVQQFHLSPERLGELMSALGLCTMLAEAVLVRIMIPWIGEKRATQVGLLSFAIQCIVLGGATKSWHLFVCVGFSLLGNLVYPSLSSLVSGIVEPESNGEALGAINGVKALTEGIGPLIFGGLMTISEDSNFPGWPYWIAAILVLIAYKVAERLPDDANADKTTSSSFAVRRSHNHDVDDFVYELQFKQRRYPNHNNGNRSCLDADPKPREDEEYQSLLLLSEVEEEEEEDDNADNNEAPVVGRMPFQDAPNQPLDMDGGNIELTTTTTTPQFALPASMKTTTTTSSRIAKPKTLFPPN